MQQVAKAATPGAGRRAGEQAQRILGARPRAQTEQIVVAKMAKAKALGTSPQAAGLEQQARDELLLHPPAVRRFNPAAVIRKAKADGQLLACFDQAATCTEWPTPTTSSWWMVVTPAGHPPVGATRRSGARRSAGRQEQQVRQADEGESSISSTR